MNARIEIVAKPDIALGIPWAHLYIVWTTESGSRYEMRFGPDEESSLESSANELEGSAKRNQNAIGVFSMSGAGSLMFSQGASGIAGIEGGRGNLTYQGERGIYQYDKDHAIDYPKHGGPRYAVTIASGEDGYSSIDILDIVTKMHAEAKRISGRHVYNFYYQNSNTAIRHIVEFAGLTFRIPVDPNTGEEVYAPGSYLPLVGDPGPIGSHVVPWLREGIRKMEKAGGSLLDDLKQSGRTVMEWFDDVSRQSGEELPNLIGAADRLFVDLLSAQEPAAGYRLLDATSDPSVFSDDDFVGAFFLPDGSVRALAGRGDNADALRRLATETVWRPLSDEGGFFFTGDQVRDFADRGDGSFYWRLDTGSQIERDAGGAVTITGADGDQIIGRPGETPAADPAENRSARLDNADATKFDFPPDAALSDPGADSTDTLPKAPDAPETPFDESTLEAGVKLYYNPWEIPDEKLYGFRPSWFRTVSPADPGPYEWAPPG